MFRSRRYRHDNEQVVLVLTVLLVLGVIVVTSAATFCLSGAFIIVMFGLSAWLVHAHHQSLIRDAASVDPVSTPGLAAVVDECQIKLQPGQVDVFLAEKRQMNAYTFGISSPKVLVLYTPLVSVMDPGELKFVIGHEMGHVALGHTWLNTIVGGLAGIPAPFGAAVLLYAAFRWWNRMCEFSADRAGLLACGDLNLAITALVKLVAPEIRSQTDFDRAMDMIDAQDDEPSNRLAEAFQSHPMLIRRINKLRDYVKTNEYHRLQAGVNRNAGLGQERKIQQDTSEGSENDVPKKERQPDQQGKLSAEERWPWLKPKD